MRCPYCDNIISERLDFLEVDGLCPSFCEKCDKIWVASDDQIAHTESLTPNKLISNIIPELKIGCEVVICCKEHKLHLEQGEVVQKSHKFYRVKMKSTDKTIHDKSLWFPDHWIEPMLKRNPKT